LPPQRQRLRNAQAATPEQGEHGLVTNPAPRRRPVLDRLLDQRPGLSLRYRAGRAGSDFWPAHHGDRPIWRGEPEIQEPVERSDG